MVEGAIQVGRRMVIDESLEGYVLVEGNENVVVDGGQVPWEEGHKIDQGENVSSLSD